MNEITSFNSFINLILVSIRPGVLDMSRQFLNQLLNSQESLNSLKADILTVEKVLTFWQSKKFQSRLFSTVETPRLTFNPKFLYKSDKKNLSNAEADLSGHSSADLLRRLQKFGRWMIKIADCVKYAFPLNCVRPLEFHLKV